MQSYLWILVIILLSVSACSSGQPATPPRPTSTSIPTVAPIPTAMPTTVPTAIPAARSLSYIDSGQRLGSGRSCDVALGDLDGDGDLDAFVANSREGEKYSELWLNNGLGVFTLKEQELGYGMGLDLGDLDGDGDLDVFIVGWDDVGRVWVNDGAAAFTDSGQRLGTEGGWDVALGDVDGDGDLDAFIAHEKADTVWLNDGSGVFSDSGQLLGKSYTAAASLTDVDGDSDLDAVTVGWSEPGKVWLNNGTGNFTDSGQTLTPGYIHIHGMTVGDLSGDGVPDAFMAGAPNQVWFNDGQGVFHESKQELISLPGDTVAFEDLDGDGDLDVFLAVGIAGNANDKIWLNDGQGLLSDSGLSLSKDFSSGIGLGDLDDDGDIDAFVTHGQLGANAGGGLPNEVWLNELR